MNKLAIYNFLAGIQGTPTYNTLVKLDDAIIAGEADIRCIPSYWYTVLDIDSGTHVSEVWRARHGLEVIKASAGVVLEHYRNLNMDNPAFYSYDLKTHKITEYYVRENINTLNCYDINTKELIGFTTACTWDTLPQEYAEKLSNYRDSEIVYWAHKPYGRIVGLTLNGV